MNKLKLITFESLFVVFIFFLIFLVVKNIKAETQIEWEKNFGGNRPDNAYSVVETNDKGYIIVGKTISYGYKDGESYGDAWILKTDSNGNEKWNKTFGLEKWEKFNDIQKTEDGNFILCGYTGSYGAGNSDVWLMKIDSNGNEKWKKTFGGDEEEIAYTVKQTSDKGYIICGYTITYSIGREDGWLIKTDSNGNEEWNKTFGGKKEDNFRSLQITKDGDYILTGYTDSFGAGNWDVWLIKIDSTGNEIWNKTFGGEGYDSAYSIQETQDNKYIIAGKKSHGYEKGSSAWLIKIDSNGNEDWNNKIRGIKYSVAYSILQTSDKGYIFAGNTGYHFEGQQGWIVKTDSNGNLIWNITFDREENSHWDEDYFSKILITCDGDYVFVGKKSYNATLVKIKGENIPSSENGVISSTKKLKEKITSPLMVVSIIGIIIVIVGVVGYRRSKSKKLQKRFPQQPYQQQSPYLNSPQSLYSQPMQPYQQPQMQKYQAQQIQQFSSQFPSFQQQKQKSPTQVFQQNQQPIISQKPSQQQMQPQPQMQRFKHVQPSSKPIQFPSTTQKCPYCNVQVPSEFRFCNMCGKQIKS